MAENNVKTSTSTQIRNMYSDGMAYMNIKFYNTNLSFQLYPYTGKDQNGRSTYDLKHGQTTTVNFEGAYALYQAAKDIIDGKVQEMSMSVPCIGASLTLERKLGMSGQMETVFSITKNNVTIPFRFQVITQQIKENGQITTKIIESGLGAFMKTIDGYLTGINADRHLDKLTDDYAKIQGQKPNGSQQPPQQNGYRPNNNYKKPYNNGGSFNKKPYQQNGYQQRQQQNWGPPQDMSSYNVPN